MNLRRSVFLRFFIIVATSAHEKFIQFPSGYLTELAWSQFPEPDFNQDLTHCERIHEPFNLNGNDLLSFHSSGQEGNLEATSIPQSHLAEFPEASTRPEINHHPQFCPDQPLSHSEKQKTNKASQNKIPTDSAMIPTSANEEHRKFPSGPLIESAWSQFLAPDFNQDFSHFEGLHEPFNLDWNELFSLYVSGYEGNPEATSIPKNHLAEFPEASQRPEINHQPHFFPDPPTSHSEKTERKKKTS